MTMANALIYYNTEINIAVQGFVVQAADIWTDCSPRFHHIQILKSSALPTMLLPLTLTNILYLFLLTYLFYSIPWSHNASVSNVASSGRIVARAFDSWIELLGY
jgi:hypothetical protein